MNVPLGVGERAWRDCFREMATNHRHDMFVLNEILNGHSQRVIAECAKAFGYGQWSRGPNPIFWVASKYDLAAGLRVDLHGVGPNHKKWPGYNAARYADLAVLRPKAKGTLPVAFIGTHWAPRGKKVPADWRNWAWQVSATKVGMLVEQQVKAGRLVVVAGDFNMAGRPDIPGVRWLSTAGVDKIAVAIPEGYDLESYHPSRIPAPTDHGSGVSALLTVTKE